MCTSWDRITNAYYGKWLYWIFSYNIALDEKTARTQEKYFEKSVTWPKIDLNFTINLFRSKITM